MTARYIGYNPPFVGGPQGIMSQQSDDRLIANDVLQNLLILPGELPFRPGFGVNLRNFTFEKLNNKNLSLLEQEIATQIIANDPRLIIKKLELLPFPDTSQLEINLVVTLIEDPDRNIEIKRLIQVLARN
jgi:phage baseplate assembly protein W